jgi:DNA-binding transcriptional regulator LsrR (DeoR family)
MKEEYLGSDFDDFLAEEGLLAETEAVAIERVIALQVAELMQDMNLSKTTMSKRMNTSQATLDRLLDSSSSNGAVTLRILERAALALDKRLRIEFV